MAIDIEQLILMAREQLSELPESVHYSRESLRALIKPAIALWQEETNANLQKRQSFIVPSAAIPVVAGVADLSSEIDDKGFRLDWIKESDIEIGYSPDQQPPFTVKFVNSLDRLKMIGRQDRFFYLAYLSGKSLRFREPGQTATNTFNANIFIRSAVIPSDPASLDAGIMPDIATAIANLARQSQPRPENRGLDIAP